MTSMILPTFLRSILVLMLVFGVHHADAQTWEKYKKPKAEGKMIVHETRYDYSDVARQITAEVQGDYQKIKAIYHWICSNIDYDTSYSIYTADECMDAKKGVCQAYCELFYRLAEAVEVKVEIINGKSKNADGKIGDIGHSWIFAYTAPNRGILLDPTWGAGYVNNGRFERHNNCWVWFDVAPEWMLLTHFPDEKVYQFVSSPLSWKEFLAMPPVDPTWVEYGLDGVTLYKMARNRQLTMPKLYSGGEGNVELLDFPKQTSLRIGEFYTFRIKMTNERQFAIINNKLFSKTQEWKNEGNGIYSINFMPRETGNLLFSLKGAEGNNWSTIIKYAIEPPSDTDWSKVELYYPLSLPEVKQVKNLRADLWKQAGIDEKQLLQLIRTYQVRELPVFYDGKGQRLKIVSVPMDKNLRANEPYTFRFYPQSGIHWAVTNNEDWHMDFQETPDGMFSITVSPAPGKLILYVQFQENEPYWSCLEYVVR